MNKPKWKLGTGVLFAIVVTLILIYAFFQDERLAQVVCLVSACSICALVQRWSLVNEKFGKLLGCMGLVLPACFLPFLSKLPFVDAISLRMSRFCSWFVGHLGMDQVVVISNKDCLQIVYWSLFWVICGSFAFVKWLRSREKVPQLKERDYAERLEVFTDALFDELKRINKETNWQAESFTPIDAEVDATVHGRRKRKFDDLHRCINAYRSKNSVFLVLGDPGSGKSVAMRKLAMDLLKETKNSGIVPVYIDLKHWDKLWSINNTPTQKDLVDFIRDRLADNRSMTVDGFLSQYFQLMLENGRWYFIFDSFDELPCLMGRDEDSDLIQHISNLLYDFLSAPGQGGGIIASRLFRGPRQDLANVVTLRLQPFSDLKINTMLKRYRIHSDALIERLFHERHDLIALCRNPFSLSLLIDYLIQNGSAKLPKNQLEMYNSFLESRLKQHEEKIQEDGFRIEHVSAAASALALYLQNTPGKGIECTISDLKALGDDRDWEKLLKLLANIRLCRYGGSKETVSFVHRRFQEFFVVQDILNHDQQLSPAEYQAISHNSGIRDALVLYCEVAPADRTQQIAQYCWKKVRNKIVTRSNIGNPGCVELVNTLYFMAEAFRSRPDAVQLFLDEFQTLLGSKLEEQTDYYVQHAMVSCMVLFQQKPMQRFALQVLRMDNRYLSDLVLLNCRAITEKPSALFNTEFIAYIAALDHKRFLQRFRNTDFSLSQLPQLRYIRNMHRLCMAAEISLLLYCGLLAAYAPFIYLLNVGFHPADVSMLFIWFFSCGAMIISSNAINRLNSPVSYILLFLCVVSPAEFFYTGFSQPVRLLLLVGVPVILFQMTHIIYSLRCGYMEKQYTSNWAICITYIIGVIIFPLATLMLLLNRKLLDVMHRIAPYTVLGAAVWCLYSALKDPIAYLRDRRWLEKQPTAIKVISRAELEANLRRLRSTKGSCQYLQMLRENKVRLEGKWPNGDRPVIDNDQIDQLLTRLDAADKNDLSRHF